MSIPDSRIISEHIIRLDMIGLRDIGDVMKAGKKIKVVMKYCNRMRKEGYIIEQIKPKERGYSGKGLFYGVRVKSG